MEFIDKTEVTITEIKERMESNNNNYDIIIAE